MGKKSPPPPPDPRVTAQAQTAQNIGTAIANNQMGLVDQETPWYNVTYKNTKPYMYKDPLADSTTPVPQIPLPDPVPNPDPNPDIRANVDRSAVMPGNFDSSAVMPNNPGLDSSAVMPQPMGQQGGMAGQPNLDRSAVLQNPGQLPPGVDGLYQSGPDAPYSGPDAPTNWREDYRKRQNELKPGDPGVYEIPRFKQIITLPEEQQRALELQQKTGRILSETALERTNFMRDYLGQEIQTDDLSGPVDSSDIGRLNLRNNIAGGGSVKGRIGGMGRVQGNFASGGDVERAIGGAGRVRDQFGDGGDLTRSYGTNFSNDRRRVENALMDRMDRQFAQDEDAMRQRLANQGISLGSEAYKREMDQFARNRDDARMGAILAGGQEQSRLAGLERDRATFENQARGQQFGQNMQAADFANRAQDQRFNQAMGRGQFSNQAQQQQFNQNMQQTAFRNQAQQQRYDQAMGQAQLQNSAVGQRFSQNAQQAAFDNAARQSEFNARLTNANLDNSLRSQMLNERFALRNQPLNEIAALMSGSQVQNPGLSAPQLGSIPTTDYAGIVQNNYQNQLGAWNAQNANRQSLFGGLLGLGGNIIMASDRRLKRDIERVGEVGGLSVYEYQYVWGGPRHRGYMADEVAEVMPEAVVPMGDYLALDYAKLPEVPA